MRLAVQVMSLKCVCLQEFDSPEELKTKVETLAQWIKESQYMVVHSGAGISTSTGIPDFRYCTQSFHGTVYRSIIVILLSFLVIFLFLTIFVNIFPYHFKVYIYMYTHKMK